MLEYFMLALVVYLWLVGGIFIAVGAANADFRGVPRMRIGMLVLGWPAITLYALFHVIGQDAQHKLKRFWGLIRER